MNRFTLLQFLKKLFYLEMAAKTIFVILRNNANSC